MGLRISSLIFFLVWTYFAFCVVFPSCFLFFVFLLFKYNLENYKTEEGYENHLILKKAMVRNRELGTRDNCGDNLPLFLGSDKCSLSHCLQILCWNFESEGRTFFVLYHFVLSLVAMLNNCREPSSAFGLLRSWSSGMLCRHSKSASFSPEFTMYSTNCMICKGRNFEVLPFPSYVLNAGILRSYF